MRKYTIGPYGRVTLHQAQVAAQKVFTAKLEGRDLAAEKRQAKRRVVADRVDDLLEAYLAQHVSQRRSGAENALFSGPFTAAGERLCHLARDTPSRQAVPAHDKMGPPRKSRLATPPGLESKPEVICSF